MKQKEFRKKIKILSYGTIHALGGITGPVNTPFFLPVKKILGLLNSNVKINEVLPDGSEIELTFDNFDTVNYTIPVKNEQVVTEVSNEEKIENPVEEEKITIINNDVHEDEDTTINNDTVEETEENNEVVETVEDENDYEDIEKDITENTNNEQENHYYKKNNYYKNNKNKKNNYNKPKNN